MKIEAKITIVLLLLFLTPLPVMAAGLPWLDHRAPFDFVFSNHIDTHQQTQILPDGTLQGYLYVVFTGEKTDDGIPYAEHDNCNERDVSCQIGWEIRGIPGAAVFLTHVMGDHPLWAVPRSEIPMPGSYTHFHWTGLPEHAGDIPYSDELISGYFLQLTARDTFIFRHGDEEIPVVNGEDNSTHINIISATTVLP